MCQTGDRDHLGRAEQKAEARHDDAAEARALALAAHAVEREQQRRQQDVHHTERIEPQVPRLDDEHDARHVQHEARNLVFRDRLVQEQEGEQRHEHGVAGKQHADDRRLDARDGQLIQRHTYRDAHQAQQGKRAERFAVKLPAALFQFAHGERNEHQPADEKPAEIELDRVELSGDQLQRDLHAGKQQRRDRNVQIASFHICAFFVSYLHKRFPL